MITVNIVDIILLLAAAQGLFLAALIFHKHRTLYANRFLGSLILLYSILLLHLLFGELGYSEYYPHLTLVMLGIGFLMPPLHYLYTKFMVREATRFRKTDWLHFLPFILYEGYRVPQCFQPREKFMVIFRNATSREPSIDSTLFNWALLLVGFIYVYLTILILNRYSRHIKDMFSSLDKIKLDWLRNITYMMTAVLSVFLLENILFLAGINLSNAFTLTSVLTAVYVYALGYLGFFKSEVFATPEVAISIGQLAELDRMGIKKQPSTRKYEKSGLSTKKAQQYLRRLLDLMETQQPYIESDLTLGQLAEMLSLSPHNLSQIINTQLRQNFFDFINQYRVEKVKRDLADPKKKHLTLLAIAFDAGFSSKSSFNTIFKKYTHLTPSEYRKQALRT